MVGKCPTGAASLPTSKTRMCVPGESLATRPGVTIFLRDLGAEAH